MSWNDLKPAEITQKLPETSHIILFLVKINYFQVGFVIIFHAEVFFGQIWFQKQKFFKLTEIWDMGTLLYTRYDFNVYFFKILFIHSFWANMVLKSVDLQIEWSPYSGTCYKLIAVLVFIFSKFLSFIFFVLIWSQNQLKSKLTRIWSRDTLLHAFHAYMLCAICYVLHVTWFCLYTICSRGKSRWAREAAKQESQKK